MYSEKLKITNSERSHKYYKDNRCFYILTLIVGSVCPAKLEIKDTEESSKSASCLDFFLLNMDVNSKLAV